MVIPILFAAVFSLLTTSAENPLCCYATERGWIVYALGSPDLHIIRPNIPKGFTKRTLLMSGKLTPSNVKNHKVCAIVVENRLIVEYDYDFGEGFPSHDWINTRCRGECFLKDLFDGKVVDQKGQPTDLMSRVANRAINGDLLKTKEKEVCSVNCYENMDGSRLLGWFEADIRMNNALPTEIFNIKCPFNGAFKILKLKDRFFFITNSGTLYTSTTEKNGKSSEIKPVFLGFGEPITAVVCDVGSTKTFVFTRTRYFELCDTIPSPTLLSELKHHSYSKSAWMANEQADRSYSLYYRLVQDKVIEPTKIDAK